MIVDWMVDLRRVSTVRSLALVNGIISHLIICYSRLWPTGRLTVIYILSRDSHMGSMVVSSLCSEGDLTTQRVQVAYFSAVVKSVRTVYIFRVFIVLRLQLFAYLLVTATLRGGVNGDHSIFFILNAGSRRNFSHFLAYFLYAFTCWLIKWNRNNKDLRLREWNRRDLDCAMHI
jgi:hypothetical protein